MTATLDPPGSPGSPGPPALAPAPPPTPGSDRLHAAFLAVNRFFGVPALRAGLGPWLSTPIAGYLALVRVRGRRTGLVREIPLGYFLAEGSIWVLAGFGPTTQWYRNLLADPACEVVLPGRTVRCVAEDVREPDVRRRIVPPLVRSLGLAAGFGGVDPRASDERIVEALGWVPLLRLRPVAGPIAAGPDDPGGTGWIWRQLVVLALAIATARVACRAVRGLGAAAPRR